MASALTLLFICGLPDAMVVPVLRALIVDRYGVGVGAAHLFMSVNLIGAAFGAMALSRLRRRWTAGRVVVLAAAVNGALLGLMALPIGAPATFAIRTIEGGADIVVYAVLFDLIARAGVPSARGRRMGLAAMVMMLGIATGMALGGVVGSSVAANALWAGSAACLLGCVLARVSLPWRGRGRSPEPSRVRGRRRRAALLVAPALMMMFSDRAVASLFVSTIPLYLASVIGLTPATSGGLIGLSMLLVAVGTWPAGRLVDSVSGLGVRLLCALVYASTVALFPLAMQSSVATGVVALSVIGLCGAGLFASSLVHISRARTSPGAMGAYYTAGNAGFFVGPLLAGWIIARHSAGEPPASAYHMVFWVFAGGHAALTVLTIAVIAVIRRRMAGTPPIPASDPLCDAA